MQINLLIFGQLTEIIGASKLILKDIVDTDSMIHKLHLEFPELGKSNYRIAVDNIIISESKELNNNSTVALLPPFSGG